MTLLTPLALVGLALIPLVVLLHALRPRPRPLLVSAAFLWRNLGPTRPTRRSLRRPPLTAELLCQLLAVIALTLSLTQPQVQGPPPRGVIAVIDASGSMLAVDVTPNRFEAALAALRSDLASLSAGDRVSLIRAAARPTLIAHDVPPGVATARLDTLRPSAAAVEMRDALALADSLARSSTRSLPEIKVYTDGAFPDVAAPANPVAPMEFQITGTANTNQSIVRLWEGGATASQAGIGVTVANHGGEPMRRGLIVSADGIEVERRTVSLPPDSEGQITAVVPARTRRVRVELAGSDALPADDSLELVSTDSAATRVLLVSRSGGAIERALRAIPGAEIQTIAPDRFADAADADVVVLDGYVPSPPPALPLLVVNPPLGTPLWPATGHADQVAPTRVDPTHWLLAGLDTRAARFNHVAQAAQPAWARAVVDGTAGPLVLEGRALGRPTVLLTFDANDPALQQSLALPLLVNNALAGLKRDRAVTDATPDEELTIPVPPDATATLIRPDGGRIALTASGELLVVRGIDVPGRYRVVGAGDATTLAQPYVRLASRTEGAIAPRAVPTVLPTDATARPTEPTVVDLAPWCLAAALLAFAGSWLFARRAS
ncbi:MAG: BatA and WFA domain-containing protein [Chloroflexota bacterium]